MLNQFVNFMCPSLKGHASKVRDLSLCERPVIGTWDDHDYNWWVRKHPLKFWNFQCTLKSYSLSWCDFWLGVGCLAWNTFYVRSNFGVCLEVSVKGWLKNILYQFIKGQTQFDMPRGIKMSLALTEPKHVAHHSNWNTTSEHAITSGKKLLILYIKQSMENHWGPTLNERPI